MKAYMIYEETADEDGNQSVISHAYYMSELKAQRAINIIEAIKMAAYLRENKSRKGITAKKDGRFRLLLQEIQLR